MKRLLLCAFLSAGLASASLVSSTSAGSTNSNSVTTSAISTLTANTIIVVVGLNGNASAPTITDSQSNTSCWTAPTLNYQGNTTTSISVWLCSSPSTSGTHTFTATATGKKPSIVVYAFTQSGVTYTTLHNQHDNFAGSVSSNQVGSIATSSGQLVLTADSNGGSSPGAVTLPQPADSQFATPVTQAYSSTSVRLSASWMIESSGTSENPTWTYGSNVYPLGIIASFSIPAALSVTTSSLPGGSVGTAYSQNLLASGGTYPYSWTVSVGSLPSGLNLTGNTISGTPTTIETASFTVQVTDAASATATAALSIAITAAPALSVTTSSLPNGTVGAAYSQTLAATGGATPYSWTVTVGSLPSGLNLTGNTISGTPTTTGTSSFTVQVTDNLSATATAALSILVNAKVLVSNTNLYFSPYNSFSDCYPATCSSTTLQSNNVRSDATRVVWNNPGAYLRTVFSGTSAALNVSEVSGVSAGKIEWSIDNGALSTHTLNGSETSITLATGLSNTTHTLYVGLYTLPNGADRYTGSYPTPPVQSLAITGLTLDSGATVSAPANEVAVASKTMVAFGDSILEGYNALAPPSLTHNASRSWAFVLARALNAEIGMVGFSGQGWSFVDYCGGCSGQTVFTSSTLAAGTWSNYLSGKSRLFSGKLSPVPDYVVVNHGHNDGSGNIVAAVQAWLVAIRAAVNPTTPIYVVVPFTQVEAANLTSAVAGQSDPFVYLVNLGNVYETGARWSTDGTHPTAEADAWIGGKVTARIQALISAGTGSSGPGPIVAQ